MASFNLLPSSSSPSPVYVMPPCLALPILFSYSYSWVILALKGAFRIRLPTWFKPLYLKSLRSKYDERTNEDGITSCAFKRLRSFLVPFLPPPTLIPLPQNVDEWIWAFIIYSTSIGWFWPWHHSMNITRLLWDTFLHGVVGFRV